VLPTQAILSVDTKKKELVGNFANAGATWRREADEVNAHDLLSDALYRAAPYGLYDVLANKGTSSSAPQPTRRGSLPRRWPAGGRASAVGCAERQELFSLPGNAKQLAFSPDGKRLAVALDRQVKLLDAETSQETFSLKAITGRVNQYLAFSPHGHRLGVATSEGQTTTVTIWDATPVPEKP
jgi:WD40 repeat protein